MPGPLAQQPTTGPQNRPGTARRECPLGPNPAHLSPSATDRRILIRRLLGGFGRIKTATGAGSPQTVKSFFSSPSSLARVAATPALAGAKEDGGTATAASLARALV